MKRLAISLFVALCALAALAPLAAPPRAAPAQDGFPGWPAQFDGATLTALPLSPIEERFQQNFPGRVGRFTDGKREIILRFVAQGTRKLHPASDCFKANGYALVALPIALENEQRWSGFRATRKGTTMVVRERIVDSAGAQWSDVSAWYWAVQMGQTSGPWWAVTVAHTETE
ncbi:hypothetical protein [Massilia sp. CF038]|uniref:hypothetical protein n=1 Tax=Massilia sp. CF038 TaxID=1881045 RepID=UPI000910BE1B|nr:hypothetical protein [Massilia sp. CF038]SHG55016.1 hypothetical protein SAMN05428948_0983 [Massilia sp. CF038]